jgi:hypothetical protein
VLVRKSGACLLGRSEIFLLFDGVMQVFPELPDELASTLNRGSEMFSSMAAGTPWVELAKGFAVNPVAQRQRAETIANIESLVDEISAWISASPKDTPALLRGDYTN